MSLANAILQGNLIEVEQKIQAGADLEGWDEYGFTPLIESVIADRSEITEKLLKQGVAIDGVDSTGRSALHWAVDNHNVALCNLLLQHKANANSYTHHGQPLLVLPLLRRQEALKQLLYKNDAKLSFAQDFIQVKLLGHRYSLQGPADIVNPKDEFIEIDYEGFFLEFTVNIILDSLSRYPKHFAAQHYRHTFNDLKIVTSLFKQVSQLLQYQKYTIDIKTIGDSVDSILRQDLLWVPIAYEGHAISFIRYRNLLIRCDRGENSKRHGGIIVYRMQNEARWNKEFVKQMLYKKQSNHFISQEINDFLELTPIANMPITSQITGNCSWSNVEAAVLAILGVLHFKRTNSLEESFSKNQLQVYNHWLAWDKARSLNEYLQSFDEATPARKATIAMVLGAILFQSVNYQMSKDLKLAKKLIPILRDTQYQYVLQSYLKTYWIDRKTAQGHNLSKVLDHCGISFG